MATLTVDDVDRLPDPVRDEFYAWLTAEGLMEAWIVEGSFGEGELRATCVAKDDNGEAIWFDTDDGGDVEYVERIFTLKQPPPASVRPFMR